MGNIDAHGIRSIRKVNGEGGGFSTYMNIFLAFCALLEECFHHSSFSLLSFLPVRE